MFAAIINFFKKLFGKKPPVPPSVPATPVAVPSAGGNSVKTNKYAFLVGINKYVAIQGNDLNGCVNDVTGMMDLLVSKYEFSPDNIRMVCDERATKLAILDGLKWLVKDTAPGDQLVFHYSGHGSQIRDDLGDELDDHMTEILCPTDLDWDDPLTDDMLANIFKQIAPGSFLTFICDACHSGTMDKGLAPNSGDHPPKAKFIQPPIDIRVRGRTDRDLGLRSIGVKSDTTRGAGDVHFFEQRHLLLSGCRDNQTSADAWVDGKYQGALTASILKVFQKEPRTPWLKAHEEMLAWLKSGYAQVPQLSGPKVVLEKTPYSASN